MSTAKQLISAFVDAPPLYWDRSYVQNMREIRGYPNWWRIRDDVAYIDGPPNEGEQYTRDLYVWSVEIVKDEDTGENTNKLELYDLDNTLEETTEVVNGETVYYWKYREQEPELTYEHTDVIDSVSLEFDQLGRRLIAFESAGDVFLIWYDPVLSGMTVTNWGSGYTPQIVTDTYRRTGGSADSERLLFYADNATRQIVYRRQDDRYGVVYNLPPAPSDVLEILKVSKNIYGGLTVLYVYEDAGELKTGSFTARFAEDAVAIGTDDDLVSESSLGMTSSNILEFTLKVGGVNIAPTDESDIAISTASVLEFALRSAQIEFTAEEDIGNIAITDSSVNEFSLKSSLVNLSTEEDVSSIAIDTSSISEFTLEESRIDLNSFGDETSEISITTAEVFEFNLG